MGRYVSPPNDKAHSLSGGTASGRFWLIAYGDRTVLESREGVSKPREEVDARPKNWLVPSLLLMLRDRDSYGYELMERLTVLGFEATNIATVYRALRQMEKEGMVGSDWEVTGSGPARRVYSITGAGEAYLGSWMNSLEHHQKIIEMFFRVYANGKDGSPRVREHGERGKADG